MSALLHQLWRRGRRASSPARAAAIAPGGRVRLRTPLASSHTVWIPAGTVGIVVGGDRAARKVSIELDSPRTVVTVPWSWVEPESEEQPSLAATRRDVIRRT